MAALTFTGGTERKKGPLGEIKWNGASGVYIVVDRANDMFFVIMQDSPSGRMHVITTIRRIIHDALET